VTSLARAKQLQPGGNVQSRFTQTDLTWECAIENGRSYKETTFDRASSLQDGPRSFVLSDLDIAEDAIHLSPGDQRAQPRLRMKRQKTFARLAAESAFSIKRDRVTLMAAVTHQSSRVGR